MDALAVVSVSKRMGSEGFSGGGGGGDVRPAVGKVQAGLPEAKLPPAHASEPALWYKISDTGRFLPDGQRSSFHASDVSEVLKAGNVNESKSLITGPEAKQLHRRPGKVSRCNSSGSKRSRIVQLELSMNELGDTVGCSSGTGSSPAKCIIADKTQVHRQRNNSNSKRGDKRNGRVPKSRSDSFFLKNGLFSFSSAVGSSNFLVYGTKSDNFDVTNLVDVPLNELLDGSYSCPNLVKDKGKAEDSNENLLHSYRKACSLLRLQNPIHNQNAAETDNNYNEVVAMGPFSSGACATGEVDNDKSDSGSVNQPASNKVSWTEMELWSPWY